jgi:hypothetical protein
MNDTPNFEFLNCAIKHYACYSFMHYKNITIDDKAVAAVLKLVTPTYVADLNTVVSTDGLNLYVYHSLSKILKDEATFLPLTFWNTNGIVT